MAIGSGLAGQVGIAEESTFGTFVASTRFHEPMAEVSFGLVKNVYQGGGVAAGRFSDPGTMRVVAGKSGTGTLQVEVRQSKMGILFKHIFGSTPTPTVQNTSTGYLQAHTFADNFGKSLTIQSGVPDVTGTVRPYSFLGCKVLAAEFSCTMDGAQMLSIDFSFRDVTEAQALATASYTSGQRPFTWLRSYVKLGTYGSEASVNGVRGWTLRVERPQDVDRRYAGNGGLMSEPIMNDKIVVSGTVDVDYYTKADFADRFAADTSTAMILGFEDTDVTTLGGAPAIYPKCDLRVSQTFFNEGTPKLNGPGIVATSYSFVGQNDLTNPVVACNYISADSTL